MLGLVYLGYFILGMFQFAAIMAGLQDWTDLSWSIAVPLAVFIAYMPLVGTVVGMFAAVTAWHWSWLSAAVMFIGPVLIIIMLAIRVEPADHLKPGEAP